MDFANNPKYNGSNNGLADNLLGENTQDLLKNDDYGADEYLYSFDEPIKKRKPSNKFKGSLQQLTSELNISETSTLVQASGFSNGLSSSSYTSNSGAYFNSDDIGSNANNFYDNAVDKRLYSSIQYAGAQSLSDNGVQYNLYNNGSYNNTSELPELSGILEETLELNQPYQQHEYQQTTYTDIQYKDDYNNSQQYNTKRNYASSVGFHSKYLTAGNHSHTNQNTGDSLPDPEFFLTSTNRVPLPQSTPEYSLNLSQVQQSPSASSTSAQSVDDNNLDDSSNAPGPINHLTPERISLINLTEDQKHERIVAQNNKASKVLREKRKKEKTKLVETQKEEEEKNIQLKLKEKSLLEYRKKLGAHLIEVFKMSSKSDKFEPMMDDLIEKCKKSGISIAAFNKELQEIMKDKK